MLQLTPAPPAAAERPRLRLLGCQTLQGLGSTQGVDYRDGRVYVFGDAETGVIREFEPCGCETAPRLETTGRCIRLTCGGENLLPHPTGLTHHPQFGTFLGDTVRQRGVIWRIDWDRALRDGCLDRAIVNRCEDDEAVNGCRPEFVHVGGRTLVASSDYGPAGNEVRLYDPTTLGRVSRTSEGCVVARFPCGPWVQGLHWIDKTSTLVLVQNQVAGLRYRLTFVRLGESLDGRVTATVDLANPDDELEGFTLLDGGRALLVSSSRQDNAWFANFRAA